MKNKLFIFFFCLALLTIASLSCNKEVGKEPYILSFSFSSGETKTVEFLIYEKPKEYRTDDGDKFRVTKSKGLIHLQSRSDAKPDDLWLKMFKTETKNLSGLNIISDLHLNNASFAAGQNVVLSGLLTTNGSYYKKGKKFTVHDGTFTLNWNNAPDYGEPVQVLSGTWTLKRK